MAWETSDLMDVVAFLIEKGPGRTEEELAEAIYARNAYQKRVNQDCRMLADRDTVESRRFGGPSDLYRYYPKA